MRHNLAHAVDAATTRPLDTAHHRRRATDVRRSPSMQAHLRAPKGRFIPAQGKRSAALGNGPKKRLSGVVLYPGGSQASRSPQPPAAAAQLASLDTQVTAERQ